MQSGCVLHTGGSILSYKDPLACLELLNSEIHLNMYFFLAKNNIPTPYKREKIIMFSNNNFNGCQKR